VHHGIKILGLDAKVNGICFTFAENSAAEEKLFQGGYHFGK
jgi:hypothetical protein